MSDLYDILLIEDSPTQALRFQLLLQRAGYRVHIIADGAEGWRVACDDLPRLILLDVDLPTMDGFQVLARLKRGRATAKIPIIMLTNREHVSNVMQALDMGADNYLPKPDALEQLQSAVEELLN
jgi:DNA-binding response OmpR family regulator